MKKFFYLMAIAIVGLAFVACGKNASPENATEACLKSYVQGDYKGMIDQYYFKNEVNEETKEQYAELIKTKVAPELEKKGGLKSYTVGETTLAEDGQSAVVKYTLHYGDGSCNEDQMDVVLVDGKWMPSAGK
jgi:hypothetical protein